MIAPLFHSIPLFSSLANEDIEELARAMTQMDLPGRTALFREGDAGDRLYVVRKGEVEVIKGMGTPE
jgi:CRP/FNR family cyclic AMP-dependent transcriptional regulator